jgi:endonuclease III
MPRRTTKLEKLVSQLEKHYGRPQPPPSDDPFELILWEQVAYLADDDQRAKAFKLLRERVGLKPEAILNAPEETLLEIAKAGGAIAAAERAKRMRKTAMLALTEWGGDLRRDLREPLAKARKALMKFDSIGEPGAEKILLFARAFPSLALESNGLRALIRLGYAEEQKNYGATYRAVRDAVQAELKQDFDWLIAAHQLLRAHGQETCKRSTPLCAQCPISESCDYFSRYSSSPPQSH